MNRLLNLPILLKKNSYFLLGPRGTGKSYWVREQLSETVDYINLLRSQTFLPLQTNPSLLANMITQPYVVIDEIQRIPELLNEVHHLIETQNIHFLLTGSSARKLKKSGVNLLAGRARKLQMAPFCWQELQAEASFDLEKYLLIGGLPSAYLSEDIEEAQDYLYAYVDTYLKEEVQAEALVRNLANYHRFLENAAIANAQMLNFSKIGNDAHLSPNTVRDYYQILEDTLLGFLLPAWTGSQKRKAIQTAKFYFFDIGVCHALRNIEHVNRNSDLYGQVFEHFLVLEVRAFLAHHRLRASLTYWRSKSGYEVDLLIGDDIAIEIKASSHASPRDHRGLNALAEEKKWKHLLLISQDPQIQSFESGITHWPWEIFLQKLWNRELL